MITDAENMLIIEIDMTPLDIDRARPRAELTIARHIDGRPCSIRQYFPTFFHHSSSRFEHHIGLKLPTGVIDTNTHAAHRRKNLDGNRTYRTVRPFDRRRTTRKDGILGAVNA